MTVIVIGAAGELGQLVVAGLTQRGVSVRGLSRRPRPGCTVADLADPAALDAAFADGRALFLVSSPTREQVTLETNAINAAERAGIEHIVKVSNIPIAGLETGLHGNHRMIERRLDESSCRATVLQPSFFTSVINKQRELIARGRIVLPIGRGKIAWIDPRDIAAVAVETLTRSDLDRPLQLTGPEALGGDEVAARLRVEWVNPPLAQWRDAAERSGLDPWLAESTVHLYEAVARGALSSVTDTVTSVTGRAPRRAFE
ncbi:MAG TPA: NAD(P)H-binding protein [Acidimicrobiia bacterium]|nr:NAD(P)H-binding protein [Acidimicrobiia bacterium]